MCKRIISLLLLASMMLACASFAQAADAIKITKQPQAQTVTEGEGCTFSAYATGNTGTTWRLCSPDGKEDFPFTYAADYFPELKVSGKNSHNLSLKNIPGEMDGWLVYCVYNTKNQKVATDAVVLHVTDRNGNHLEGENTSPEAFSEVDADATFATADGEKILRTYGCYMQFIDEAGNAKGDSFTELNFGEEYFNTLNCKNITDGSVDVLVTADVPKGQKVEYWIINGTKYTFNVEVKRFTLRELPYGMTIEAVFGNDQTPQTLLALDEIMQQRTDEVLLVEAKSARMSHLNEKGRVAGPAFTTFDFTDDFINKATGEEERGGRVTVRVSAIIPEGKLVNYWRFNGARLNFNSDVTAFVVEDLPCSMVYQPFFYRKTTPAPTATPVPEYTINCRNCVFSGGGYTDAKSGTVPYGTKITITPVGNSSYGWWNGSYNSNGAVKNVPVSWTVMSNCSFEWNVVVN